MRLRLLRLLCLAGALAGLLGVWEQPAGATSSASLAARLELIDAPLRLRAGETGRAVLEVTNLGAAPWPANGPIRLAYHLRDDSGAMVMFDGDRTLFASEVPPGGVIRVCARLRVPAEAGRLTVEWDLVHEGVTWLSQLDPAAVAKGEVDVITAASSLSLRDRAAIAWWVFLTVAHGALCIFWARGLRRLDPSITADERWFVATVVWLGTWTMVVHVTAVASGLSLASATVGFVAVHGILRWWGRPGRSVEVAVDRGGAGDRWLELLGLGALLAICIQWVAGDVMDGGISGTDAAHYHVPHAINLALRASPFDPPATGHLYPMGASALAAWFILPLGSGQLVDSATLPYFLMLAASLCWLFRQVTGLNGLAVVPWFLLAALAMPVLRLSVPLSADLPFAAVFVAWLTYLVAMLDGRPWRWLSIVVAGMLSGLLLGTKTVALPVLAAFLALLTLGRVIRRLIAPTTGAALGARLTLPALALGIALGISAGGVWQVRNWWNYGSPAAPVGLTVLGHSIFPGDPPDAMRYYWSVAGDIRESGAVRVWRTARRHMGNWAGPWLTYVPWLLPLVLADALIARRLRRTPASVPRLLAVSIGTLLGVGLTWLLVGAPWTSLTWTEGRALRYVLPMLLLGWFVVLLAIFPLSLPWYRNAGLRLAGTSIVALGAAGIAWGALRPPEQDAGRHLLLLAPWAPVVGLVLSAMWATGRVAIRASVRRAAAAGVAATILATGVGTTVLASRAASHAFERAAGVAMPRPCLAPPPASDHEAAARLIAQHHRRLPHDDGRRRVYVAARFDWPLALQERVYDTLVYEVRLSRLDDPVLGRARPGTGDGDYLVSTVSDTPLLTALAAEGELVDLGTAGAYRVWYIPRRPRPQATLAP